MTIRRSPKDEERLNRLALKTARPKVSYLRKAIEAHLDDMEEIYLAQSRLEAVRAGRSNSPPARRGIDAAQQSDRPLQLH